MKNTNKENTKLPDLTKLQTLINNNNDKISELKLINEALYEKSYSQIITINNCSAPFDSDTILDLYTENPDEIKKWFEERFLCYYDLPVSNIKISTYGYTSYLFGLEFDYNDTTYKLTIPNLSNIDELHKANNGKFVLMIQESESSYSQIFSNYYIKDIIEYLKEIYSEK